MKIELLRAAEAAFADHGLAAAKVEDITARAGVSKGAFYLHFQSKDDCFRSIVEGFIAKLADCIEPPPTGGETVFENAGQVLDHWYEHDLQIFEFCWQNRALMKIITGGGGGTHYGYLVDEFADRASKNLAAWIEHGRATGLYREDVEPQVVAALIAGGYDRLVRELIKEPKRPDLAAWVRQAVTLFTRGLLTPEGRRAAEHVVDSAVSIDAEQATGTFGTPGRQAGDTNILGRGKRAKGR